jgi:hypothetical protein
MLPFPLLEGDDSFSIIHPFSGFRFCVMFRFQNFYLINVAYPMHTRKAHMVSYNELCHHLWDFLASSMRTHICNPVGPGQFCALPSECLTLWQLQQLNVFVLHASSVVDHAWCPVNLCLATVENHAPYLPVFMVLHILHTTSPTDSGFSLVQHTSHTKIKTHSILRSLPWFRHI